jgi:hypothetical protein
MADLKQNLNDLGDWFISKIKGKAPSQIHNGDKFQINDGLFARRICRHWANFLAILAKHFRAHVHHFYPRNFRRNDERNLCQRRF